MKILSIDTSTDYLSIAITDGAKVLARYHRPSHRNHSRLLITVIAKLIKKSGLIKDIPIRDYVAATSVGIVSGELLLDLCYEEDSKAEVDMNVVMTGSGRFVEVQGTGEEATFSEKELSAMLDLARGGIRDLTALQQKTLGRLWCW